MLHLQRNPSRVHRRDKGIGREGNWPGGGAAQPANRLPVSSRAVTVSRFWEKGFMTQSAFENKKQQKLMRIQGA